MAGPEDYVGVRPPFPASYVAPLIGPQLGDRIAALPELYQRGKERNAFPNGLVNPDGTPMSYQQVMDVVAKSGGLEGMKYLGPLLQMQMFTQAGGDVGEALGRNAAEVNAGGRPATPAAPGPQSSAASNAAAVADTGDYTTRIVATEMFPNKDVSNALNRWASSLGTKPDGTRYNPDDKLTEGQVRALRVRLNADATTVPSDNAPGRVGGGELNQPARTSSAIDAQNNAVRGGAGAPSPESAGVSGAPGPIATPPTSAARITVGPGAPTQAAEPAAGGGNLTPRPQRMAAATAAPVRLPPPGPPPGTPPQGAPAGAPPVQVAQAGPPAGPQRQASPLDLLAPPGVDSAAWARARIQYLNKGIQTAQTEAAKVAGFKPKLADTALAQAKTFQDERDKLIDALAKAGQPTTEMQNAQASGSLNPLQYETEKAAGTKAAEQYQKLDAGIQGLANTTVTSGMLDTLHEARALMDAGTATGWGADWRRQAQQFLVQFKLADPNAAFQLEAFNKQMAGFINQQMNTLKAQTEEMGMTGGRLFVQNVDNMNKAAPSDLNTPAGNRFLIESYRRASERAIQMADMANAYKAQHGGRLDANFETQMRQWFRENPMMKPAEVKDPRLFAPPMFVNVEQARARGVTPGSPVRLPNGDIFMMPHEGPQQQKARVQPPQPMQM